MNKHKWTLAQTGWRASTFGDFRQTETLFVVRLDELLYGAQENEMDKREREMKRFVMSLAFVLQLVCLSDCLFVCLFANSCKNLVVDSSVGSHCLPCSQMNVGICRGLKMKKKKKKKKFFVVCNHHHHHRRKRRHHWMTTATTRNVDFLSKTDMLILEHCSLNNALQCFFSHGPHSITQPQWSSNNFEVDDDATGHSILNSYLYFLFWTSLFLYSRSFRSRLWRRISDGIE